MSASDYRRLFKKLRKAGFTIGKTSKGHYKVTSPDGKALITPGTASDHRSLMNFKADLRRYCGWEE